MTSGWAAELASLTHVGRARCEQAIRDTLELGYALKDESTGFPVFAFRLHQFFCARRRRLRVARARDERFVTTQAQQFVPTDDRDRVLLPLAFCRECGQDYYIVARSSEDETAQFEGRLLSDTAKEDDTNKGFLYLNEISAWPATATSCSTRSLTTGSRTRERWPPAQVELRNPASRRHMQVGPDGAVGAGDGVPAVFVPAPFRFCLTCGVAYDGHQTSDIGKLTTLGSGGRSSATSLLSLTTISNFARRTTFEARRASCWPSPTTARTRRSRPDTSTTSSRSACFERPSTGQRWRRRLVEV